MSPELPRRSAAPSARHYGRLALIAVVFTALLAVLLKSSFVPALTPGGLGSSASPDPSAAATAFAIADATAGLTPGFSTDPTPTVSISLPLVTSSPSLAPSPSPSPGPTPTRMAKPTPRVTPAPTPRVTPSPSPKPAPAAIKHVVIVWMENEESSAITASSMPYLYGLSETYGRADRFYAVSHPSLPNYLALWSGSTHGVTNDATYNLSGSSLSRQMAAAGKSWRSYAQNYPTGTGCHTGSTYSGGVDGWGVAGTYARKHNPAMSFTSVSGSSQCGNIQSLARFDPDVSLAFVAPNLCNDMHDCSLATGDAFLRAFLPHVFDAPDWAHTLLIVSFDEGSSNINGGGRVFSLVARQGLSGFASSTVHNHYGLLHTVEDLMGLPCLANACSATPLTEFLP